MPDTTAPNGWNEWSKYVLKALESNEKDHQNMQATLNEVNKQIAMLQVKSGVWGFAAGAIPSLILLIAWVVQSIVT
jgi:hypothetical protein